MKTLYLKLLAYMQSKCDHPPYAVHADIEEGARRNQQTQWCQICGAYRFKRASDDSGCNWFANGEWEVPRPDWHTPKERKQLLRDLAESK